MSSSTEPDDPQFDAAWTARYHRELLSRRCSCCGGGRLTSHSRGKPAQDWVRYHAWATKTLGYTTHVFGSCTEQLEDISTCVDCGKSNTLIHIHNEDSDDDIKDRTSVSEGVVHKAEVHSSVTRSLLSSQNSSDSEDGDVLLIGSRSDGTNGGNIHRKSKNIEKYLQRVESNSSDDEATAETLTAGEVAYGGSEDAEDEAASDAAYEYIEADDLGDFNDFQEAPPVSSVAGGSASTDETESLRTEPTSNINPNPRLAARAINSPTYIKPLTQDKIDSIRSAMAGLKLAHRPGLDSLLSSAIANKVYRVGDELTAGQPDSI